MNDYLWNPAAPEDAEVAALERTLRPLRFDAATRPFTGAPPALGSRVGPRRKGWALAAAAVLTVGVASLTGWYFWRLDWDAHQPWPIDGGGVLAVGARLDTQPETRRVRVARLGVLSVMPGADLSLRQTLPTRHTLDLRRGRVLLQVWAPPGRVVFQTPAGDVVDLGCIFSLDVDPGGRAVVQVRSGWVSLENSAGTMLVPAGASTEMSPGAAPLVPVFDDAPAAWRVAVRAVERGAGSSIETVASQARHRDAVTLLLLSNRAGLDVPSRERLLARAAELWAPPSHDSVRRILDGDRAEFWTWYDTLPLPPLKNWWVNWRDAITP